MSGALSGLFGNPANVAPDYTGLQLQTAVNTLPIPIVWGMARIAPNVIWYDNFQTNTGGKNGKGGLFSSSNQATYTAALILALCEGPIAGINYVWKNQSAYSVLGLGLSLFDGGTPQSVWAYLTAFYPAQALAYQGTAFVCSPDYNLGAAATIDNHNFEIVGFFGASGVNGVDADPAQLVNDLLINAQYGVGFPAGSINATTLFGSGGDASYQTYCKAIGLALSPALVSQEQASSILARWLQLTNTAAVWSGGQLKFIPYGDMPTAAGTVLSNTTTRQIGLVATGQLFPYPTTVCAAANFVADGGVKYANSSAPLAAIGATQPTTAGTYGISPNGSYLFAVDDQGSTVEITYQYKVAASYAPNTTPIYNLTDDDFKVEHNEDPLQVTRSDPFSAYNVFRLEVASRANAYALTTVEARDQSAIEMLSLGASGVGTFQGMRIAPTVTAHEICDLDVAALSAQLMLQRSVYIRNTYKFRLSWEYCLLDPMDLVTVSDAILGLSNAPIRITEIEEDENGFLSVAAEEFPLGIATATLYPVQPAMNNPLNRGAPADAVNRPIIFEPPSALVGASAQIWMAASGGAGGVADPNWGGANVWASTDGTSYIQIGSITAAATMGVLTAALPTFTGTNPDTADTLAVDLVESGTTLTSATDADAQLGNTLCVVDDELISFATATLTTTGNYSLSYLYRGLYGTAVTSHASGAPFAFINNSALFKYDLPSQYVGVVLYFKFQSFNVFGGGGEALLSCTAYTYTPTGAAVDHPVADAILTSGGAWDFGPATATPTSEDDWGASPTLTVEVAIDFGTA